MSAFYAPSGKPAWAVTCWVDREFIYTEIPCVGGPPIIEKYPLTEGGLTKALAMQKAIFEKLAPQGGYVKLAKHPINVRPKSRSKYVNESSQATRDLVHAMLKKRGVI